MTMITLYTFGPGFGLPDPSPFVMKAEVLLRIAGLPLSGRQQGILQGCQRQAALYRRRRADCRFHRHPLAPGKKHKIDFDRGLSEEQPAVAWAFERRIISIGRSWTR
jgi:hypothetical protein